MKQSGYIKSINKFYQSKFKEKGSQFIGLAYPVISEDEISGILERIKKQYYDATHRCYAYKLKNGIFKYYDDGEPNGTAGLRIFNALDHYGLTDIIVIVVRYFGGVKLGVGPLGKAYYNSADITLKDAEIIEKKPFQKIEITVDFQNISQIHRLISNYNAEIVDTSYDEKSHFSCLVEPDNVIEFQSALAETLKGSFTITISDEIIYK